MDEPREFESIDEYRAYADTLPLEDLLDISKSISKEQYPDRYQLIIDLLSKKREDSIRYLEYPKGVLLIRNTYIVVLSITFLGLIIDILLRAGIYTSLGILPLFMSLLAMSVIIAGIHLIKPWVVTLVLLFAYLTLARSLLVVLSNDPSSTSGDGTISLFYAIFCAYQVFIFSKQETKRFFRHRGIDIIG